MLWNLLIFGMITSVFSASSKRDDYTSNSSGSSQSVSFPSSSYSSSSGTSGYSSGSSSYGSSGSPTYTSGSSGYNSGSSAYGTGSSYGTNNKAYSSGGTSGYASASTSTGSVSSQPASQGNLYYYYYPVQEKPQDGSSFVAQGSSSSGSYSSSSSADNYDGSSSAAAVAYGNQVAGTGNGDYEAQESSFSGAVSPLDANYGAAGLGSLGGFGAGSFGSNGLVGGGGYAAAASAPAGYAAAAPSVAYSSGGYGNNLVGYAQQYGGYGYPQSPEYNGGKRFGLSSLIMPMLALAGLGLLIPTVTNLGSRTKKTKRSLNDPTSFSSLGERLDRYLAIYRSATESEECVSRIVCELGNTMTDMGGKTMILSILEKVVPSWMKQKMGVFKNAVLSSEAGKCRKYKC